MITATAGPPSLASLRRRWADLSGHLQPLLTIRLLASYTADPVVPYLGVRLLDGGLPAELTVGPYHQIVQQCLDDASETGRSRPDVLLVAARFEEVGTESDLLAAVTTALDAARRWRSCLLVLLPEVPDRRPRGVGDAASPDGTTAMAARARERLRSLLAGRANVHVVDAEEVVRRVGAARAYRPALYAHARVPYAEEVFDLIAQQVAAVLLIRYLGGLRAVVLDADALVGPDGSPDPGALAGPLADLRSAGLQVAVRSGQPAGAVWPPLSAALPSLCGDPQVRWQLNERPGAEQLAVLADGYAAAPGQIALLTADGALASQAEGAGHRVVMLDDDPEQWWPQLTAAGMFDALGSPGPARAARQAGRPQAGLTLASYVAGLGVEVTFRELGPDLDDAAAEVVDRAHDFTLGRPARPDRSGVAFAAAVRDRLGDYGTSAVVTMRPADDECLVDVFSVSCPVLGRGVEDVVLDEIVARAARAGCRRVRIEYQESGRNAIALDFLRAVDETSRAAPSGRGVQVRAWPAGTPS